MSNDNVVPFKPRAEPVPGANRVEIDLDEIIEHLQRAGPTNTGLNDPGLEKLFASTNLTIATRDRVIPNLIAERLIGVQPMGNAAGEVFSTRHVYIPWYVRCWRAARRWYYLRRGYEYVSTKMGCFGPTDYRWVKKTP
jgi:hypothetical protein